MTIKKKMLLLIICFVIMPILLMPVIQTRLYEDILEKNVNQSTQQALSKTVENINVSIDDMVAASNYICSDTVLREILANPGERDQWTNVDYFNKIDVRTMDVLSTPLNTYQAGISIFGSNGIAYSSLRGYTDQEYRRVVRSEWYLECVNQRGHILWLASLQKYEGLTGNMGNVALARAITDDMGKVCGVLVISMSAKLEYKLDTKVKGALQNEMLLLYDDKNEMIVSNLPDKNALSFSNEDLFQMLEDENGTFNFLSGRDKVIVNYNTVKKTKWKVVQLIKYGELMKDINALRWFNILLNFLLMAVLVAIAVLISSSIANPLHRLGQLMGEVAKGEFNVRAEVKGKDEISRLTVCFNNMVERMEKLIKELHESYVAREKLRLEALRAQINPHFLFNTLNSIKWFGKLNGEPKTSRMISALGRLLELTLTRDEELIPLSDEIQCLQSYVLLQKLRFGEKFDIEFEIDEKLKCYKIPGMILQPLVENSIIHGFDGMESGGIIHVEAYPAGEELRIEVWDNGIGIKEEDADKLLKEKNEKKGRMTNIGLKNVNDRISLIYGSGYGLQFFTGKDSGFTVRLNFPLEKGVNQDVETLDC